MSKSITELVNEVHENAVNHGFWDFYLDSQKLLMDAKDDNKKEIVDNIISSLKVQFLALINCEVSECVEALRKEDKDNFNEELADVVIRALDLAGGLGIDLEKEIVKKIEINKTRPYKHNKKF